MPKYILMSLAAIVLSGCNAVGGLAATPQRLDTGLIDNQLGMTRSHPIQTTLAGARLPGSYLGGGIGENALDLDSQAAANQAVQASLYYGQSRYWRTSTSAGRIYPARAFRYLGVICRGFTAKYWSERMDQTTVLSGTACRNRLGQWVMRED